MAASVSFSSSTIPTYTALLNPKFKPSSLSPHPISNPIEFSPKNLSCCFAARQQQAGPVKKRPSSSSKNNKRTPKKNGKNGGSGSGFKKGFGVSEEDDDFDDEFMSASKSPGYHPPPLPKPLAGFVVDDHGSVLMASDKRIATIVDPENNMPLECVIRRIYRTSKGHECMLLCPVDTPVQILKSVNFEGWIDISEEEFQAVLPTASYALAKIQMHLVNSGFCYTARGGFCYTEDDIIEFTPDDVENASGMPTEGVEITCFHRDGSHYMLYTPFEPLVFVAVKDANGQLQIAGDEVLDDPATANAVDEETEFNALVEEEAALLESLLGLR